MRSDPCTSKSDLRCGIIVIGRNEGAHLRRALKSAQHSGRCEVLYVDSGSTDGSIELAWSMGVAVHALDPGCPFSAARARREGVEVLLDRHPALELLQFLDGDCELAEGWMECAAKYLEQHKDVAIVCGKLTEKDPEGSAYNRLSAMQWREATGDVERCGGVFMIRRDDYVASGGFNHLLVTGEEEALCRRIRRTGRRIVRLDWPMAVHDSGLTQFPQWWARAVWGGYGDAIKFSTLPARTLTERCRHLHQRLFWPFTVPAMTVCGSAAMMWSVWWVLVPFCGMVAYLALFARIVRYRRRLGDSANDAVLYSFMMILRKVPVGLGFMLYFIRPGRRLKPPDPHAASAPVSAGRREAPAAGRWA